jgi:hypothetical protein
MIPSHDAVIHIIMNVNNLPCTVLLRHIFSLGSWWLIECGSEEGVQNDFHSSPSVVLLFHSLWHVAEGAWVVRENDTLVLTQVDYECWWAIQAKISTMTVTFTEDLNHRHEDFLSLGGPNVTRHDEIVHWILKSIGLSIMGSKPKVVWERKSLKRAENN